MSAALAFYAVWALPYKGGAEQLGPVCPDAWQNQTQTALLRMKFNSQSSTLQPCLLLLPPVSQDAQSLLPCCNAVQGTKILQVHPPWGKGTTLSNFHQRLPTGGQPPLPQD